MMRGGSSGWFSDFSFFSERRRVTARRFDEACGEEAHPLLAAFHVEPEIFSVKEYAKVRHKFQGRF